MEMKSQPTLEALVEVCRRTHEASQRHAASAVNKVLVIRNYLLGYHIVEFEQEGERRAPYGATLLEDLSARLSAEIGRGFSVDSLEQMRRFYLTYASSGGAGISETPSRKLDAGPTLIPETVSRIFGNSPKKPDFERFWVECPIEKISIPLSWSHYVTLLSVKNPDERSFYEIEAAANDWSLRELKRQINSSLFERLALSRDKAQVRKLAQEGQAMESPADLIKNPYVLEFLGIDENASYSESELKTAIIDKLEHFLLELGKGFLFEARQKRFTFDEDHYYVDLVFYNRLLRCYTLIDLKIGELTHQDLGQMQMYVNYYDRHVTLEDENPTVGIILCKRKKDALVEITLPEKSNIHASEYQLYLPSKEELKAQIDHAVKSVEDGAFRKEPE